MRASPNQISPPSGRYSPAMMLNRVDFPAPFGPMRPVTDFGATVREQRSTATIPPNVLTTLSAPNIVFGSMLPPLPENAFPLPENSLRSVDDEDDQQHADEHEPNVWDRVRQKLRSKVLELDG